MVFPLWGLEPQIFSFTEDSLHTYMIEKVLNNYLMARSSCFHQRCISIHWLPREKNMHTWTRIIKTEIFCSLCHPLIQHLQPLPQLITNCTMYWLFYCILVYPSKTPSGDPVSVTVLAAQQQITLLVADLPFSSKISFSRSNKTRTLVDLR